MWINEKIQLCSHDDTYRDGTSVQVNPDPFANEKSFDVATFFFFLGKNSKT